VTIAEGGVAGAALAVSANRPSAEIEKFAHVIFSSSPAQREFWLGERAPSVDQLSERDDGCKPCLHGGDAHNHAAVGQPTGDRFSWIKGALNFDVPRRACVDPAGRAIEGAGGGTPSPYR